MPAFCALTGKTYHKVHKRSKSLQDHIVRLKPNLLIRKVGNRRIKISASAWKTLQKKMKKKLASSPNLTPQRLVHSI